ncbi:MAG TPA: hypothetical protein VGM29_14400 [Polyangiaceae bacterium]|jgi:hypothetical protein
MNGPVRLREGSGAAGRLLGAADIDVPSDRARRRAVAFAGAATTLAAAGTSAAATGSVLLKGIALWFCVGAVGGAVTGYGASELSKPRASSAQTAIGVRQATPSLPVRTVSARPPPAAIVQPPVDGEPAAVPSVVLSAAPARRTASNESVEPQEAPAEAPRAAAGSSVAAFATDSPKPTLTDELKQIEAARAAFGRGDFAAALSALDRYERAYPAGSFRPEALALRIQALSQSGAREQARTLAAQFIQKYPQHPLLSHVRAAVGE